MTDSLPSRAAVAALGRFLPSLAWLAGGGPIPAVALAFDDHLFVVTSDFVGAGNCAALELNAPWTVTIELEPVGTWPVARHYGGRHYVVDGTPGDDVRVIDAATFETLRVLPLPAGSNPQDIVVIGDGTAFVSSYDHTDLLRIDLGTGEIVASVDLGAFADPDGVPEMRRMARDGDRVFVQLQRLDRRLVPDPQEKGRLAVVSIALDAVLDADPETPGVQAIELAWYLPRFQMQIEGRLLYVSEPGAFEDQAGGIEAVDLDTLEPLGLVYHEKAMGTAQMSGFVLVSPERGYVLHHTDLTQSSHIVSFERAGGTFLQEHFVSFGLVETLAFDAPTGLVYFPDSDQVSGVRVFDASTGAQLTASPIPTGLRPADLVIARDDTTGPPPGGGGRTAARVWAAPNPARGATWFRFDLAGRDPVEILLLDASGRVVRRWGASDVIPFEGPAIPWDGRAADGSESPAGRYFLRLSTPGDGAARGSVTLLR